MQRRACRPLLREALTVSEVRGFSRQKEHTEIYRGRELRGRLSIQRSNSVLAASVSLSPNE